MQHRWGAARRAAMGLGILSLVTGMVLTGAGGAPLSVLAQTIDPGTLRRQQIEALNASNVVAVMETFNDDAVYLGTGLCAESACVGKAAIQKEIERQTAERTLVTIVSRQVTGPTTSVGRINMQSNSIRDAGVDRIAASDNLELKNNRFSKVEVVLDLADAKTAGYQAIVRSQATGASGSSATGSGIPVTDTSGPAAAIRGATAIPQANAALTAIPAANSTPPAIVATVVPATSNVLASAATAVPAASTVVAAVQVQPQVQPVISSAAQGTATQLPSVGSAGAQESANENSWLTFAAMLGVGVLSGLGLVRKRRASAR
jgi:hypothetical protein